MSLLSHYTWNEDDASNTRDYSTNGNDSTAMAVVSIVASDIGKAVDLDGTADLITFGDINNVGGTDTLSIFARVNPDATQEHIIAHKKDQYTAGIDVARKAFMKIVIGASTTEITSTTTVGNGSDSTIAFVYDGSLGSDNLKIYINGVIDATTVNITGNLDASTENFLIGSDTVDFFDGQLEVVSVYSDAKSTASVLALNNRPGGLLIDVTDSSGFSLGDLIELTDKAATAGGQGVLTGIISSTQILYLPISSSVPNAIDIIKRRGNVFDTDRQWIAENIIESEDSINQLKDRVDNFTKAATSAEGTKGYRFNKDALQFKAAMVPDFTIEPTETTGQIDDFSPTDIEFATTLYIAGDGSSWTGLLAPSPVRPQLMFIINSGSTDIPVKMEDSGSIAANRFISNGDLDMKIDEMGFVLYDVVRTRWRISKFT